MRKGMYILSENFYAKFVSRLISAGAYGSLKGVKMRKVSVKNYYTNRNVYRRSQFRSFFTFSLLQEAIQFINNRHCIRLKKKIAISFRVSQRFSIYRRRIFFSFVRARTENMANIANNRVRDQKFEIYVGEIFSGY